MLFILKLFTKSRAPSGVDLIKYGFDINKAFGIKIPNGHGNFVPKIRFSLTGCVSNQITILRRNSSPPSVSFSIVNGGVLEAFNTVNSVANISDPPKGNLGFSIPFDYFSLIWITSSRPNSSDLLKTAGERSSSKPIG